MACVVDASALIFGLLGQTSQANILRQRLAGEACHAPHLIDAEVGNVLRRQVHRRQLVASDAETLMGAGAMIIDHRYEMTGPLAKASWNLRDNASFYDGLYVALAAALSLPLLSADVRLFRAAGPTCSVELVGTS